MNIVKGFNTYLDFEQLQCREKDEIMLHYEHCKWVSTLTCSFSFRCYFKVQRWEHIKYCLEKHYVVNIVQEVNTYIVLFFRWYFKIQCDIEI